MFYVDYTNDLCYILLCNLLTAVFVLSLMVGSHVFAMDETITLEKNSVWNVRTYVPRTGKYSYVEARLFAVYPTDGSQDTYRYIKTQIWQPVTTKQLLKAIMKGKNLDERKGAEKIPLKEGALEQ